MSTTENQEMPIVRENYEEDIQVDEKVVSEEEAPQQEETAAPAQESDSETPTPEGSVTPEPEGDDLEQLEEEAKALEEDLTNLEDLFPEDEEEAVEEDGPTGEAAGSNEKPSTTDSALKDLYDPKQAEEVKEKARRHAMDADGKKTTALVEATTAIVDGGEEVVMDDLAWLNEEDDLDFTFEDLFPENLEEELALEDGSAPALAIADESSAAPEQKQEEEIKMNAFEEGLERLKRKRVVQEMTPEQAEDKMEDLICKMTTAADEDCEVIRKNMAKERLHTMCEKAEDAIQRKAAYLGKKDVNTRFQRLYKFAQFPNGKDALRSYFDEHDKFAPAKALAGTKKLLKQYGAEPALNKMGILKHCIAEINKPTNQSWFVTFGGLSVIKTWLTPSPDGTLPALSLRTELLKTLEKLPVTQTNLRKSKLGMVIKELLKRDDETLSNRKLCQELINKWLSLVLDTETSIRRHRAQMNHDLAEEANVPLAEEANVPAKKRQRTKQQISSHEKEVQERRHPQMFQKPSHNFTVQPSYDVKSNAHHATNFRQTRKGKIGKLASELRAMRPSAKHDHVSISGTKINLSFN